MKRMTVREHSDRIMCARDTFRPAIGLVVLVDEIHTLAPLAIEELQIENGEVLGLAVADALDDHLKVGEIATLGGVADVVVERGVRVLLVDLASGLDSAVVPGARQRGLIGRELPLLVLDVLAQLRGVAAAELKPIPLVSRVWHRQRDAGVGKSHGIAGDLFRQPIAQVVAAADLEPWPFSAAGHALKGSRLFLDEGLVRKWGQLSPCVPILVV